MPSENRQHSFRSACERCRLHKLKCTTPSQGDPNAPPQCTRCTRAKAECIFRRRAPPRHRTASATGQPSVSGETNSTTSDATTVQPTSISSMSSINVDSRPSTTISHSPKPRSVWETFLEKSTVQETEIDFSGFACLGVPSDLESMSLHNVDMSASALQQGFSSSYTEQHPSPKTVSPDLDYDNLEDFLVNEQRLRSKESSPDSLERDSSHSIIRLSSLIKEIHETQHMLQQSSSYSAASISLAGYPIGRVLHAAQTFTSIVTNLTAQTSQADTQAIEPSLCSSSSETAELSSLHHEFVPSSISMDTDMLEQSEHMQDDPSLMYMSPRNSATASPDPGLDTSITMLVFCSYVSLSKLYCNVFQFFEENIHTRPQRADDSIYVTAPLQHTRMLQLGELSTEGDTDFKVLKAVRILLDAFQAAETSLGMRSSLAAFNKNRSVAPVSDESSSDTSLLQQHLMRALTKQRVSFDDHHLEKTLTRLMTHVEHLKVLLRMQNGLH